LDNITAGVREREHANRTREAGHLDEIQGVVANTLKVHRNGAVGFIDWLDFGTWLINELIIIRAFASLRFAARTSLYIAAEDVEFSLNDAAIVTGLTICSPVLFLGSVANAIKDLAADTECCGDAFCHAVVNLTRKR
jgi:hypothetical protein